MKSSAIATKEAWFCDLLASECDALSLSLPTPWVMSGPRSIEDASVSWLCRRSNERPTAGHRDCPLGGFSWRTARPALPSRLRIRCQSQSRWRPAKRGHLSGHLRRSTLKARARIEHAKGRALGLSPFCKGRRDRRAPRHQSPFRHRRLEEGFEVRFGLIARMVSRRFECPNFSGRARHVIL